MSIINSRYQERKTGHLEHSAQATRSPPTMKEAILAAMALACLTTHPALSHPNHSSSIVHSRAAGFLRQCRDGTPRTVASINHDCPNIQQGLIGTGSQLEILATVIRQQSGQQGRWHRVRVIQNSQNKAANQNAQAGTTGWMQGNKLQSIQP